MRYLLIVALAFLVSVSASGVAHASTTCYGFGSSNNERQLSTSLRYSQTFVAPLAAVVSASFNIYGNPADAGTFFHQIVETTAGVPNTTVVSGSGVTRAVADVPDAVVGVGQAFTCGSIPALQTFTYSSPVLLVAGDIYALSIHQTGGTSLGRLGVVTGFPSIAVGEGYTTENVSPNWQLTEFPGGSGINFDTVYSLVDETVDINNNDGKIDGHIQNLREYLKLDNTEGGLMFGLGIVSIIFMIGLMSRIPFLIVAVFNLVLVGIFSRAQIMPPWVLLAVVAVAGIAVVFRMIEGRQGGKQSES